MALTKEDLDALDEVIGTGTQSVRYADGRQINYRPLAELQEIEAKLAKKLDEGKPRNRRLYAAQRKGFR